MLKELSDLIALFADDRLPPLARMYLEYSTEDLGDIDGPTKFLAKLVETAGEYARVHEIPLTGEEERFSREESKVREDEEGEEQEEGEE
jgi:hypothetical protein